MIVPAILSVTYDVVVDIAYFENLHKTRWQEFCAASALNNINTVRVRECTCDIINNPGSATSARLWDRQIDKFIIVTS
jgi:hypothetical protein